MFQSRIPFNRREPKEQVLPLLQPPLNRLFVPRAHPDFMPSLDKGKDGYLGPRITDHVGRYMWALGRTESDAVKLADPTAKKERLDAASTKLAQSLAACKTIKYFFPSIIDDPKNNPQITGDPFKTLFVGRLPYDITERKLKREFERYGTIRQVKLVHERSGRIDELAEDQANAKSRGYAFVEFDREKDMKVAYVEADGLKIEGRRILVDVERGRTVTGWKPRRLGGGLGRTRLGGKDQNQRYSGRDPRANEYQSAGRTSKRPSSPSPSPSRDRNGGRYHERGSNSYNSVPPPLQQQQQRYGR